MIDVELFRKLFVHRDDVYTVQNAAGDYFKVEKKLTDQSIEDHFLGKHTLGLYQLKREGEIATVKWDNGSKTNIQLGHLILEDKNINQVGPTDPNIAFLHRKRKG